MRPQMSEFESALMTVERPSPTETPMSSFACDADARSAEIFYDEMHTRSVKY